MAGAAQAGMYYYTICTTTATNEHHVVTTVTPIPQTDLPVAKRKRNQTAEADALYDQIAEREVAHSENCDDEYYFDNVSN